MTERSHPTKRQSVPVRLDRLAKSCLGPAVARQGFSSAEILTAWAEIVGPELARRSRPERIRWPRRSEADGAAATLVVRAEGGDALEIQHMQAEILARLNGFLGWRAVAKLALRQAPVHPGSSAEARRSAPQSAAGEGTAAEKLAQIDDPGLREAFARLARARTDETDNSA